MIHSRNYLAVPIYRHQDRVIDIILFFLLHDLQKPPVHTGLCVHFSIHLLLSHLPALTQNTQNWTLHLIFTLQRALKPYEKQKASLKNTLRSAILARKELTGYLIIPSWMCAIAWLCKHIAHVNMLFGWRWNEVVELCPVFFPESHNSPRTEMIVVLFTISARKQDGCFWWFADKVHVQGRPAWSDTLIGAHTH